VAFKLGFDNEQGTTRERGKDFLGKTKNLYKGTEGKKAYSF
jgi:hypothetical protein